VTIFAVAALVRGMETNDRCRLGLPANAEVLGLLGIAHEGVREISLPIDLNNPIVVRVEIELHPVDAEDFRAYLRRETGWTHEVAHPKVSWWKRLFTRGA
jgi:hypothetical protein